jgi:hypothetical protein
VSSQVIDLQLPSGRTVQVRKADPLFLGMIGLGLATLREARGDLDEGAISDTEARDLAVGMCRVIEYVLVSPKLSNAPKRPGEIHPREMALSDATFLVFWGLAYAEAPTTARGMGSEGKDGF